MQNVNSHDVASIDCETKLNTEQGMTIQLAYMPAFGAFIRILVYVNKEGCTILCMTLLTSMKEQFPCRRMTGKSRQVRRVPFCKGQLANLRSYAARSSRDGVQTWKLAEPEDLAASC